MSKKLQEHTIKEVLPDSIAEELGIEAGDVLVSINEQPIRDVFDYRYLSEDEELTLLIRKPDGEEWELEIEKDAYEDLGLVFEDGLMGTTVVIDHGEGLISTYANLGDNPLVEPGDRVDVGSVIGSVGDSALVESGLQGHLHLETSRNGQTVDPRDYLPKLG